MGCIRLSVRPSDVGHFSCRTVKLRPIIFDVDITHIGTMINCEGGCGAVSCLFFIDVFVVSIPPMHGQIKQWLLMPMCAMQPDKQPLTSDLFMALTHYQVRRDCI